MTRKRPPFTSDAHRISWLEQQLAVVDAKWQYARTLIRQAEAATKGAETKLARAERRNENLSLRLRAKREECETLRVLAPEKAFLYSVPNDNGPREASFSFVQRNAYDPSRT